VEMEKINITLDTLYDILRNETKKEELQELDPKFFYDVLVYLKEKKSYLDQKHDDDEIFSINEKEKRDYELRSIKRILKQIYEAREKKIIEIALNKSRTGSDIIDTGAMLREEKEFYKRILENFDLFRRGILLNIFKGEIPSLSFSEEVKEEPKVKKVEENNENKIKIKIVDSIPKFVWKDMNTYGPYEEGEVVEMFSEVAELMVKKGRAELV
jgi:DNA replication initiation complex subunit (GINS family)